MHTEFLIMSTKSVSLFTKIPVSVLVLIQKHFRQLGNNEMQNSLLTYFLKHFLQQNLSCFVKTWSTPIVPNNWMKCKQNRLWRKSKTVNKRFFNDKTSFLTSPLNLHNVKFESHYNFCNSHLTNSVIFCVICNSSQ